MLQTRTWRRTQTNNKYEKVQPKPQITPRTLLDALKENDDITELHNKLHTCNSIWIDEFIKEGGITDITNILAKLVANGQQTQTITFEIEPRPFQTDRTKIEQCVKCLSIVLLTVDNGTVSTPENLISTLVLLLEQQKKVERMDSLFLLTALIPSSLETILRVTTPKLVSLLEPLQYSDNEYLQAVLHFVVTLLKSTPIEQRSEILKSIQEQTDALSNYLITQEFEDEKLAKTVTSFVELVQSCE